MPIEEKTTIYQGEKRLNLALSLRMSGVGPSRLPVARNQSQKMMTEKIWARLSRVDGRPRRWSIMMLEAVVVERRNAGTPSHPRHQTAEEVRYCNP